MYVLLAAGDPDIEIDIVPVDKEEAQWMISHGVGQNNYRFFNEICTGFRCVLIML